MIARRADLNTAAKAADPSPASVSAERYALSANTSADVLALSEAHPASGYHGLLRRSRHSAGSACAWHPHSRGSRSRKAPPVLLRPARIFVLLPVLGRHLLPSRGCSATLDCLVLLARVPLSGHRHDGGIDDLSTTSHIAIRAEMPIEAIEQLSMTPAWASFSRNSHNVVPSGMQSSIPHWKPRK